MDYPKFSMSLRRRDPVDDEAESGAGEDLEVESDAYSEMTDDKPSARTSTTWSTCAAE